MPTIPVPVRIDELLARPNPAVMATARGAQPVSVPTWYVWENGRILVNMDAGRKRLDHLRTNPLVSLSVLAADDWYTHVSLQGRAAELVPDPDLADIDRIARHYTGNPYPTRDRERVSVWIDVHHWHGWGRLRDA